VLANFMKTPPLNSALRAAVDAAHAAGTLMRRNLHARKVVNSAARHDIKLELDVRCQQLIGQRLRRGFPEIPLLGEEGIVGDPHAEWRWVVDPIDGTVNFAYDVPHACVCIALQRRRAGVRPDGFESMVGVIYDPFQDELWSAVRGQLARLNGRRIHVSTRASLAESMVATGYSKSRRIIESAAAYAAELARRTRKIRLMGSAGLALTYVACGRFDGYVELSISLWDFAAGIVIIEQAGGELWCEPGLDPGTYRMVATNGFLRKKLPPLPPLPRSQRAKVKT
jgi:myo-inositol-1(or 4)-monophosphatase